MLNLKRHRPMLSAMMFFACAVCYGQSILPPQFTVSFACPNDIGAGFNSFGVLVQYTAPGFSDPNEFSIEISDADGNFDDNNPIFVATGITGENKTIPTGAPNEGFTTAVQLPTDVYGDNYKLRVHSSNPAIVSPASDPGIPAYFTPDPSTVNLQIEGPTSYTICGGSPITLQLNNSDFPLYQWFRDFVPWNPDGSTDPTGNSVTVTGSGNYFASVYFGPCTQSAGVNSRLVSVSLSSSSVTATIAESDIAICSGDTFKMTASPSDPSFEYTWLKDGTEVARGQGLDEYTVSTTTPFGAYSVSITNADGCEDTSEEVNVTNAGTEITVSTNTDENQILLPTQSTTLNVTSSESGSTIEWFLNGGTTPVGNTFDLGVSTPGAYQATVTGSGACGDVKQSPVFNIYAPEAYEITIAPDANYVDCGNPPTTLSITKIDAVANSGSLKVSVNSSDFSLFTYEWFKDNTTVNGATQQEFTVNDRTENGNYEIEVSDGNLTSMSNTVAISLGLEAITISATQSKLCPGSSDSITLSNDGALNTDYSYQWFKDGQAIAGANTATIDINEIGTYHFVASAFGCTSNSNEIEITNFDVDTVVISPSEFVTIAEGSTQEVIATGADSYSWVNDASGATTTGDSITVSEEGTYTLTASVGSCTVTKIITVEFNLSGLIPNVVSPNGDNKNDTWILPGGFNSEKVEILIYDQNGKNVLNTNRYNNDWPDASMINNVKDGTLYYYAISKENVLFKKGTITILK
ncbi:T9SS type B sorting domain-containing protein [Spongiivirga citrea]|uniref:T9SS type B sorting domain-containing protein n=1 Tax=Spongiivirga citrea TaxID=1481457 RepID=A0A6M0CNI9_9FLAO|nr:gliding motility-associated C-terminal domain-containing protein [Spongiivirga citrea]NER17429.1 T9SS type B sorting domain-containing protein [Spongiivirga citrea]